MKNYLSIRHQIITYIFQIIGDEDLKTQIFASLRPLDDIKTNKDHKIFVEGRIIYYAGLF